MAWPILLLVRELDLGGSERQMTAIAKTLDRSRFEPIVACFRLSGVRRKELDAAGVEIAHFPVNSFASRRVPLEAWKLAAFIRRRNIRLVHTFDYPLTVFAVPAARLFTGALVLSSQRGHRSLIPPGYRRLVRLTDHLVDGIVVNCEFVRRHLECDEHISVSKIRVCYNGVDAGEFCPGESGWPSRPRPETRLADALIVGVVAALRPEKNVPMLLEAFASLRRDTRLLKLVVVGSGPVLPALKHQAAALGIAADCTFVPGTAHVRDWLRSIDLFVLPSRSEALSNSLMEAMACGCCALASEVGGNPELVQHLETGMLFDSGDVSGLTAALETLIDNESLRRRLADSGMRRIRERFSIRSAAEQMGQIYSQFIEPKTDVR